MFCRECGNPLQENSCVCAKCGAFCGGTMFMYSKKKYFKSELCSKSSKTTTTISWVLIGIIAIISALSVITTFMDYNSVIKPLKECETVDEIVECLDEAMEDGSVMANAIYMNKDELIELFGTDEAGPIVEYCAMTLTITVVILVVWLVGVILLFFFAVYNRSFKCAVWGAILGFSNGFVVMASCIAIVIFVRNWNKEYKAYCMNPTAGESTTHYNFS